MPDSPGASAASVQWAAHLWLSCGCGGNYTLLAEPKTGDEAWCYWHGWWATVNRFTAIRQEVTSG